MFGGVTHLNLDPKNRLSIPVRYREILQQSFGGKLVVTLESQQCLVLYPESNWINVREKIQNLSTGSHPLVKSYQRLVLGYAESLGMDKVGRILISSILKNLVELDKDSVFVGLGNRFEIWDKTKWEAETAKSLQLSQEDLANLLNGFSL